MKQKMVLMNFNFIRHQKRLALIIFSLTHSRRRRRSSSPFLERLNCVACNFMKFINTEFGSRVVDKAKKKNRQE